MFSIPVGVVYRPNEAKVKNLKTKDYLGKAKVIAAFASSSSERSSTPTGSLRTDSNRAYGYTDSYPPTNPAQKALASRSRQHSEPPLNRNLFPPTPPPDVDKASTNSSSGSLGRPASLKTARPPRLNLDCSSATLRTGTDPSPEKPRIGTTRTASEGPVPRQYQREMGPPLGRFVGHRRHASDTVSPAGAESTLPEETYTNYNGFRPIPKGIRKTPVRQRERFIDEEDEYHSPRYEGDPFNDGEFEIVGMTRYTGSPLREPRRGSSRKPDVRKFRVKVHAAEDTRYIIVGPALDFDEFERRIREKFGFRSALKIRMLDDGDMITMVDQEDLDLLMGSARDNAAREASAMGKMEVSFLALVWHTD